MLILKLLNLLNSKKAYKILLIAYFMFYTIDVSLGLLDEYRLCNGSSWRKLKDWDFEPRDLTYRGFSESIRTIDKLKDKNSISINGKDHDLKLDERIISISELMKRPNLFPRVHRTERPRIFTKDELITTIKYGNDKRGNVLVVNLQGYFSLKDIRFISYARDQKAPVAVRHEFFVPGNGYVGSSASKDFRFIDETYLSSLQGWYEHLKTGKLDQFQDLPASESESRLIRKIQETVGNLGV